MGREFATVFAAHTPLDLRPAYDASMNDRAGVERAFFALKNRCPGFFLGAGDDHIWKFNNAVDA